MDKVHAIFEGKLQLILLDRFSQFDVVNLIIFYVDISQHISEAVDAIFGKYFTNNSNKIPISDIFRFKNKKTGILYELYYDTNIRKTNISIELKKINFMMHIQFSQLLDKNFQTLYLLKINKRHLIQFQIKLAVFIAKLLSIGEIVYTPKSPEFIEEIKLVADDFHLRYMLTNGIN